ncbi:MAG: ATPase, T2SS/T4P/T4SS family [Candidatus Paceibacterota bacterium]
MRVEPQQLKAFLIDAELVTAEQFDECTKEAARKKQRVDDILLERKLIDAEQLMKLKAYILGIPFVNLEKENIPAAILNLIPEPIARSNNIVAFRKTADTLDVAMLDPEDLRIIEFIKKTTGLAVLPRLTNAAGMKSAIMQYQKTLMAEVGDLVGEPGKDGEKERDGLLKMVEDDDGKAVRGDGSDLKKVAQDLPVIRIVDTLIKHAILERASDIHIEPTEKEVIVRYRVDGILRDAMTLPKTSAAGIVARIKVLSNLKLDECRLPQDGRFKVESDQWKFSLRVSTLPVFYGEKIVMRLLSESTKAFPLEQLGFRGSGLEKIKRALQKTMGMVLMTGPTGSGKTTTLYSMMDILNEPGVNISTIEDPIEYQMPRINQTQANAKIGLTFAAGLRTLLRQDPNIIMVGEIRDNETASLAINAALTGHLVMSTLHTNTAAGAIPRLIDMKAEAFLISSTINIIIAQRLIRCLATQREEYLLKEADIEHLKHYCDIVRILDVLKEEEIVPAKATWKTIPFWRPKPSNENPDGYRGRIGIHEVLEVTPKIRDLIEKNATADKVQEEAMSEGMITMFEDGFIKAVEGKTSIEEVLRVITE